MKESFTTKVGAPGFESDSTYDRFLDHKTNQLCTLPGSKRITKVSLRTPGLIRKLIHEASRKT
jgi:hypothetical protein